MREERKEIKGEKGTGNIEKGTHEREKRTSKRSKVHFKFALRDLLVNVCGQIFLLGSSLFIRRTSQFMPQQKSTSSLDGSHAFKSCSPHHKQMISI